MTAYHVQAAIAAVHARSERANATCWPEILGLYDDLAHLNPSPVILLNRAVALSRRRTRRGARDRLGPRT